MAKKLVSINLDEDLIAEIDEVAESIGMSRSAFVNLVMRATCMGESETASRLMLSAALVAKDANKKEVSKNAVLT